MDVESGVKDAHVVDFAIPASRRNIGIAPDHGGAGGVLVDGRGSAAPDEDAIDIEADEFALGCHSKQVMPFSIGKVIAGGVDGLGAATSPGEILGGSIGSRESPVVAVALGDDRLSDHSFQESAGAAPS